MSEDMVVYELEEWDPDLRALLGRALDREALPYQWQANAELVVRALDAPRVDAVLDAFEEREELDDSGEGGPDDGVPYETVSELFVAADRLVHDPDNEAVGGELEDLALSIEASSPPYGFPSEDWARIRGFALVVRRDLQDGADGDVVAEHATRLRDVLRRFV